MFKDNSFAQIDAILSTAQEAFLSYKNLALSERANFMRAIAFEIEALGDVLIDTAHRETNLNVNRLLAERKRTIFQLNNYAAVAEKGEWLAVRIDTEIKENNQADLRKTSVPLGVVAVFGASNFPFAYSTAGGDTACALAAGCPVVLKAHPAHVETSTLVAQAIAKAVQKCGLHPGVFSHIYGADFTIGEYLVNHQLIKAVGFTGSYSGGRALFDLANKRQEPIPVFAEMGSTNPVFIFSDKLINDTDWLAAALAKSITQDMGQFCTNPGIMVALQTDATANFERALIANLAQIHPTKMLHRGIATNFNVNRQAAISQSGVQVLFQQGVDDATMEPAITLAKVDAGTFISNKQLQEEVFGPYSILVVCQNEAEMAKVAMHLSGQLTATVMATTNDLALHHQVVSSIADKCGRLVFNNVPTGVAVTLAMHHGGPFPSSTDSRFTAVGADGIKRFARPLTFQNAAQQILPTELQNVNHLNIWRTINGTLTKASVYHGTLDS